LATERFTLSPVYCQISRHYQVPPQDDIVRSKFREQLRPLTTTYYLITVAPCSFIISLFVCCHGSHLTLHRLHLLVDDDDDDEGVLTADGRVSSCPAADTAAAADRDWRHWAVYKRVDRLSSCAPHCHSVFVHWSRDRQGSLSSSDLYALPTPSPACHQTHSHTLMSLPDMHYM